MLDRFDAGLKAHKRSHQFSSHFSGKLLARAIGHWSFESNHSFLNQKTFSLVENNFSFCSNLELIQRADLELV